MHLNVGSLALQLGATLLLLGGNAIVPLFVDAQGVGNEMVKMCLFYETPSGHARSDPIINQQCASDHVHTFYGPQLLHPDTTYEDLVNTPPELSTSPFEENQSLYWHPSIYKVTTSANGGKTYTRVDNLEASPYYRWDKSVQPETKAFPPGFRMIAASNDSGADGGGGDDGKPAMFTECCTADESVCEAWEGELRFPEDPCGFLGIALAMPTCWDGENFGNETDHKSHMAYTLDGTVAGECPLGFPKRFPQIQLFVRIPNYEGGTYQLSDGKDTFHVDFFNGWEEGVLQDIIDNCAFYPDQLDEGLGYNPPCDCTFGDEIEHSFLTPNENVPGAVCDADVRRLILDEATDVVTDSLPLGTCQGALLSPKSWNSLSADLYTCEEGVCPAPQSPSTPAPQSPPTPAPQSPPTPAPQSPPTPAPQSPPPPEPEDSGDPDDPSCFSSTNMVEVQSKGFISMDSLQIGDEVRAGKDNFSRVISYLHLDQDVEASFLQFHAKGLETPLEITPEHLVFVNKAINPIRASQVKVDDEFGEYRIIRIEAVKRRGIYAPVTESGVLVVSGVLSSSYTSVRDYALISQHMEVHTLFSIRRLMCAINFEICKDETYTKDGFPTWLSPLIRIALSSKGIPSLQILISAVGLPVLSVAYILEQVLVSQSFLVGLAIFGLYWGASKTKASKIKNE